MKAAGAIGTFWQRRWSFALGAVMTLILSLGLGTQPLYAEWHSLTGPLPVYTDRVEFVISSDSRLVAFSAEIDTDDVAELYVVPITGTTPLKLNPPLVEDGDVRHGFVAFAPDNDALIYLADQEVDNRMDLYRVPVTGGDAVQLNPDLVAGGNVLSYKIDAKNGRVVYLADQEANEVFEVWSVPIAGGTAVKLNGALVNGGNVSLFLIDPLSNRVVYTADQDVDGRFELYSVPVAGGSAIKLNPTPPVANGGGDTGICCEVAINPVVPIVVFIEREADAPRGRVYSVPTAGGEATPLSFNLLATQRMLNFKISPAGDRVVFNVGTRDGNTNASKGNLYSNLIGGGGAANVSESADPLFGTNHYEFLPDGSRIVYDFQNNAATPLRLETATMLGERTPLYEPIGDDEPLSFFRSSPDSAWVMYQDLVNSSPDRIYTLPPTGGSRVDLGPGDFKLITPDSSRLAYTRQVSNTGASELFSKQIFGGGERNLSDMGATGLMLDVRASEDSAWFVFTVSINNHKELRVSDGTSAQPFVPPPDAITGLVATNNGPKAVGTPISFTTSISTGTEISYTWDFGDGGASNAESPSHAYANAGTYTATVVASNATNTLTATTSVLVGDAVVEVNNNFYAPPNVTLEGGGTVVWVLKAGTHSVTADDNSFEQPAGNDWLPFAQTFAAVAGTADTVIRYHCSVHGPSMAGTVTIPGAEVPDQEELLLPSLGKE